MKNLVKAALRPVWAPIRRRLDAERAHGDARAAALERENRALRERLGNVLEALQATDQRVGATMSQVEALQRDLTALQAGFTPQMLYEQQVARELNSFNDVTDVHALPAIYGYWADKYLLPMFRECGCETVDQFYVNTLLQAAARVGGPASFASVGAGNCDTEVRIAQQLRERGLRDFTIECLEINPAMLQRGRQHAAAHGVESHFVFTQADFNAWRPLEVYTAVMANQSLHHVTNLEGLFDSIKGALHSRGYFVSSDMIGRNGHQRWPEALEQVQSLWRELSPAHKYNRVLQRQEDEFVNWDCSSEGFEGVRAQDVLPLLVERFDFAVFAGFANVINPFVDRCFGHNFDVDSESDRAFIDRVHAIDEAGFRAGTLKPTQMLAVMTPGRSDSHVYARGLSPQQALRPAQN
ncbi:MULTISPECIES: class I SAM-dependent methyltransferase [unclassified Variovorax]|uniref:class I SAM-dependent methyltransferase n=1 Tax=unclassified Variovorax TaxID=663243 RepID=UPI003F457EFC